MALPNWQRTITNESGDVVAGAEIEVFVETTGLNASLFSDRGGTTTKDNPFFADSTGFAEFYAAPGEYRITATNPATSQTRTWRYEVLLGTAASSDVTTSATDTTAGRVMKVGAGGLLGDGSFQINVSDANTAITVGFFGATSATSNIPVSTTGSFTVFRRANQIMQIFSPAGEVIYVRHSSNTGATWTAWREILTTGDYPSDTAWTTTTSLDNGWTGTVNYIKRAGMVTVAAALDGTSASTPNILQLPAAYRPVVNMDGAARSAAYHQVSATGFISAQIGLVNTRFNLTYPVI
jgi:hypothetical protein